MRSLVFSDSALELIRKKIRHNFWINDPVVMLVEKAKKNDLISFQSELGRALVAKEDQLNLHSIYMKLREGKPRKSWAVLVPSIVARRKLESKYEDQLINVSGIETLPHILMQTTTNISMDWKLDIGQKGLVLMAGSVVVAGIERR